MKFGQNEGNDYDHNAEAPTAEEETRSHERTMSAIMPSLSGHARLSRASFRDTYSEASRDTFDDDSVLITELKGYEEDGHHTEWEAYKAPKKKQVGSVKMDSDGEEDYETDLEIEGEIWRTLVAPRMHYDT